MTGFKRRHFLQLTGSTLAAIGLSHWDIQRQGFRYLRSLAQPTSRKRALLVGINQYQDSQRFTNLKGCLTDVELQKELLLRRFGFTDSDILLLTDKTPQKPSRENILTAFEEFLIEPSREGDVAIFHFSGHGDRVLDPDPIRNNKGEIEPFNSTFVPANPQFNREQGTVADIMGKTLFLLVSALKTEQVTVVLDSCHSGGGTRGNVRIRSRSGGTGLDLQPDPVELAYQQQWLEKLGISADELTQRRASSVAKGVVIASAQPAQKALDVSFQGLAADATFSGFEAGVFTYFLTQYLWQEETNPESAIAQVTRSLQQEHFAQVPLVDAQADREFERQPLYFVQPQAVKAPPAEAAISSVSGNRATVWLGGIAPGSLTAFDRGTIFTPVGTSGGGAEVRLLSRRGLLAEVQLSRSLTPGTLLQETARVIPRDFKLRLGLDPSLGNETNSARQALSSLPRVEPVAFQGGNAPYSREIQYIFSRLTPQYRQSFQQQEVKNLPPTDSLGLLSQSLDEILPDSFGDAGETVAAAITRLAPKLTALVAARLLKLTLNTRSSRLSVEASLQLENQASQLIAQAFTVRGSHSPSQPTARLARQLPINVPFQFRVVNREPTALYLSILVIDSTGDITVLFPNQYGAGEESARIEGNRTLLIPNPAQDNFQFATESKGVGEALIIASRSPLRKALLALKNLAVEQESPQRGALVTPSVEAISDLLTDLSRTRSGGSQISASPQLNVSEIAALSITFEVI